MADETQKPNAAPKKGRTIEDPKFTTPTSSSNWSVDGPIPSTKLKSTPITYGGSSYATEPNSRPFAYSSRQYNLPSARDQYEQHHSRSVAVEGHQAVSTDHADDVRKHIEQATFSIHAQTSTQLPNTKMRVQSNEAANLARKTFIQDPERYWARLDRLEGLVYDAGKHFITDITFTADSNDSTLDTGGMKADINWLWLTPTGNIAHDNDEVCFLLQKLLRQNLESLQGIIHSLENFADSGFSSTSYSVITVDATRDRVLLLNRITIDELDVLEDTLHSGLELVSRHLRDSSLDLRSMIETFLEDLETSARLVLEHFGLNYPTYPLASFESTQSLYQPETVSLTTAFLFFGLLSYVRAHTGDLDKTFFGHRLDEIVLHVTNMSHARAQFLYLARQRLNCLDELTARPVWVFGTSSLEGFRRRYLSTSLADFDDIWGPLCLNYAEEDQEKVLAISTRAGSIRKVDPTYSMIKKPKPHGDETLCHWDAWTDHDVSNLPYLQFSLGDLKKLLIGIPYKGTQTREALTSPTQEGCDCKSSDRCIFRLFTLGTRPSSFHAESRTAQAGISKWISFNVSQTWKVHPATTVKDVILGDWLDTSHHEREPAYLDWYTVVETSKLSGQSRRISLWDFMKLPRVLLYIRETLGKEDWKTFPLARSTSSSFQIIWKYAHADVRDVLKRTVEILLGKLQETGVEGKDLLLWDISSVDGPSFGPNGRKFQPSWCHLVRDSENTATFAVLSDTCFHHIHLHGKKTQEPAWPQNLLWALKWPNRSLYTRFSITTHSHIITEEKHGEGSPNVEAAAIPTAKRCVRNPWVTDDHQNFEDFEYRAIDDTQLGEDTQYVHRDGVQKRVPNVPGNASIGAKNNETNDDTKNATQDAGMNFFAQNPESSRAVYQVQREITHEPRRRRALPELRDARLGDAEKEREELAWQEIREDEQQLIDKKLHETQLGRKRYRLEGNETALSRRLLQLQQNSKELSNTLPPERSNPKPRRSRHQEFIGETLATKPKYDPSVRQQLGASEYGQEENIRDTQAIHAPSRLPHFGQGSGLSLCGTDLPVHSGHGQAIGKLRLQPGAPRSEIDLNPEREDEGVYAEWREHAFLDAKLNHLASKVDRIGESWEWTRNGRWWLRNGEGAQKAKAFCKELIRNQADENERVLKVVVK